ncbi:MAG: glutamate-5-semialdehyde dehydrogenase [Candidatus Omnitrophota bacterium]
MSIKTELTSIAKKAQGACRSALTLSSEVKDRALKAMAMSLLDARAFILSANKKDLRMAKARRISSALLDRLTLSEKRIQDMADSLNEIANLADPVGEVINVWRRPNGLWINKVRVPIGVIAIIYESRPNVTSDCIGLCFKSGNSVILRGGSEAINSNLAIANTLKEVLKRYKIPEGLVNMVTTTDRAAVKTLLSLNSFIDLVMPRGGEGLINQVMKLSRIPVIKHYKGICHAYVDESADLKMAEDICYNAKVQRPGVCNALESMLVHEKVAPKFLPRMLEKFQDAGVEIRGCPRTKKIVKDIKLAKESDYHREYLDLILSVKVVKDLNQAIEHINNYGTHHSDSIISDNYDNSLEFLRRVDSACVYMNASTRFTDGYQFGLGAEIGISTDKLHARGPMALEELTTYKYMVMGNGQVRS